MFNCKSKQCVDLALPRSTQQMPQHITSDVTKASRYLKPNAFQQELELEISYKTQWIKDFLRCGHHYSPSELETLVQYCEDRISEAEMKLLKSKRQTVRCVLAAAPIKRLPSEIEEMVVARL